MATTVCASCAQPIPTGARFCPNCGVATSGVLVAPEERRIVTVLFADLVGYTSLAEHRDPEQVKRLIEACFERLVADIEEFGGRVDKLLGDGIVALFGAPVAHEDDAERAVRAGLRMQRTLGRFASEQEDGSRIEMRVGINTGEVLVGTLAGSDYTAMGDVVNTAARLQALAPPGGVLIGSATASLCSSSIGTEPFGITQIRGRDRVEESWLVTGALAAGARPVRWDVPFVGRARNGRCSTPQSNSCATATAASCRSSASPEPARAAGRGDRRRAGGRGDRRAHGLRPVRRAGRVGARGDGSDRPLRTGA